MIDLASQKTDAINLDPNWNIPEISTTTNQAQFGDLPVRNSIPQKIFRLNHLAEQKQQTEQSLFRYYYNVNNAEFLVNVDCLYDTGLHLSLPRPCR